MAVGLPSISKFEDECGKFNKSVTSNAVVVICACVFRYDACNSLIFKVIILFWVTKITYCVKCKYACKNRRYKISYKVDIQAELDKNKSKLQGNNYSYSMYKPAKRLQESCTHRKVVLMVTLNYKLSLLV